MVNMPTNRNDYMFTYMREYRKGRRRGRSRLQFSVAGNAPRCPGCSILSPTWCFLCKMEGVPTGHSRPYKLTLVAYK